MNTITYNMAPVLGDYHSQLGFWLVTGVSLLLYIIGYLIQYFDEGSIKPNLGSVIMIPIFSIIIGITAYNSFGKGQLCENQPVIAELIDKTYAETYRSGKYSSVIDTHVIYKTPDGEVTYQRSNGTIYPQQATLYKTTCTTIK